MRKRLPQGHVARIVSLLLDGLLLAVLHLGEAVLHVAQVGRGAQHVEAGGHGADSHQHAIRLSSPDATIGIAQTDIKKVLAYSTVSQLGYMFLAAGVGAFTAAIFAAGAFVLIDEPAVHGRLTAASIGPRAAQPGAARRRSTRARAAYACVRRHARRRHRP